MNKGQYLVRFTVKGKEHTDRFTDLQWAIYRWNRLNELGIKAVLSIKLN